MTDPTDAIPPGLADLPRHVRDAREGERQREIRDGTAAVAQKSIFHAHHSASRRQRRARNVSQLAQSFPARAEPAELDEPLRYQHDVAAQ